ncbi:MAG: OmpH family outer membrane protein [Planctomycetes bacterium]|nr:OmpH family outer membrane protein [Planctomycetota bacterium]
MRNAPRLVASAAIVAGMFLSAQLVAPRLADARATPAADLGPAQAVLLEGKDGAMKLVNSGGRPGWGDEPTAKAWSIGAVHVDKVLKKLLDNKSYTDERARFDEEGKKQGEEFQKEMETLKSQYGNKGKDDPDFPKGQAAVQALFERYQKWNAGMQAAQGKLMAEQVEKAYRELTTAVDVVCDRRKIDVVHRFIPAALPFESQDLGNAMIQVQSRTFLHAPEAIDLTAEVMKELNLSAD